MPVVNLASLKVPLMGSLNQSKTSTLVSACHLHVQVQLLHQYQISNLNLKKSVFICLNKQYQMYVITDNFHHLLMKCLSCVWAHFYTPSDKNLTVDVKFYHLIQTVAHKQSTTEDTMNSQIFPISKMITLHNS